MEDTEELIELFRSSGGKFENVALGYREEDGFYVYTLNSNQDAIVSCPSHLLVDVNDVGVSRDGLFISNPDKYQDNIGFLEKYIAFHFNRKTLDRYIEKKRQIDSLSSRDMTLISRISPPDQRWSKEGGDLEFAKTQILDSHKIQYFGKMMLMPFVTFLNHDKNGRPFDIQEDAISLSGKFSDEVFAMYNMGDVLEIAVTHGFIADTRFVYSFSMKKVAVGGGQIVIARRPGSATSNEGLPWPLLHKEGGTVTISWFPLYFERDPLYPAKVAQMVARETGLPAEVFLNEVFRVNLNILVPLVFQLRDSENLYAQLVAAGAQRQLEVIAGTRK